MRPSFQTSLVLSLSALLLLPFVARGDDDREEGESRALPAAVRATPQWKQYASECGSCHLAFPPQMLPARSWTALLNGLSNHFGQNAELGAPERKQLGEFLSAHAGRDVSGPAPLRITELASWRREHRELADTVFLRKAVVSRANCAACHPGAERGAFGEDQVKVPRDGPPGR